MSGFQLSYDYQNQKRDLGDAFEQVIKSKPTLAVLLNVSDKPATNTKYEWLEDIVSPLSWTLAGNYTAGDSLMSLVSAIGLKAGDILQFEKVSTGVRSTLLMKVTTAYDETEVSCSPYGGSTDENLTSGATVTLVSRPKNESTEAVADNGYEPSVEWNQTQIMDRTAKLSKTSLSVKKYGIGDALNYQVERQLTDIGYELGNTIINQARVARTSGEAGTMGSIMWFLKRASGNSVNGAGAVTQTILNNAFEIARKNGADNIGLMLVHPFQMRKISAFNVAGSNPNIERRDTTTGSYVTTYVSDQGDIVPVLVDRNMDKDKIALLDMSKIQLVPLKDRQFTDEDATPNGADYVARRILGEYTLEVKNAANSHAYVYGLTAA